MEVSPLWGSLTASEKHIQAYSCELPVRKRNELLQVLSKLCPHPRSIVVHEGNYKSTFPSLPKKENNSLLKKRFLGQIELSLSGKKKIHLPLQCVMKQWPKNWYMTELWKRSACWTCGEPRKHCDGGVYSHLSSRKGNLNMLTSHLCLWNQKLNPNLHLRLSISIWNTQWVAQTHNQAETQPSRTFKAMVNSK